MAVKQGCFWKHDRTQKYVNIETTAMTRSTATFPDPCHSLTHSPIRAIRSTCEGRPLACASGSAVDAPPVHRAPAAHLRDRQPGLGRTLTSYSHGCTHSLSPPHTCHHTRAHAPRHAHLNGPSRYLNNFLAHAHLMFTTFMIVGVVVSRRILGTCRVCTKSPSSSSKYFIRSRANKS